MSGHIGLREEARAGHLLARRIAGLFAQARQGRLRGESARAPAASAARRASGS
jgi:hypothetical protein